jgi:hypothetical protein
MFVSHMTASVMLRKIDARMSTVDKMISFPHELLAQSVVLNVPENDIFRML